MKDNRKFLMVMLTVVIGIVAACSNSSDDATLDNNQSSLNNTSESTADTSQSSESSTDSTVKSINSGTNHTDGTSIENKVAQVEDRNTENNGSTDTKNEIKENESIQEDNATNTVTKIEGRRKEFIDRLDNIQKELDTLPEKKDSDKGVTNAMKNYYGRSYEIYDKELNEIYAFLKKELSPEIMADLNTKQIKWIEQKEDTANEERLKYNGGTFENVAYYITLYELTKEKCYELVNKYMTD